MHHITRTLVATGTGLALAFGAVAAATPAVADTPSYVSKTEFNQIRKGMPITKVHRIFDLNGKQTSYSRAYPAIGIRAEQSRDYRVQSKWGSVTIDYQNVNGTWKVSHRSAYWGSDPAGTRGYVTRAEFNKLRKGMPMAKVHRIIGTAGTQTIYDDAYPAIGIRAEQSRDYRVASKWGSVSIDYQNVNGTWKLDGKSAYWG